LDAERRREDVVEVGAEDVAFVEELVEAFTDGVNVEWEIEVFEGCRP
jgi:hypothetical protein